MDQAREIEPPPMRSSWPTTFGVIAITVGVLGFMSAASQIANVLLMESLGSSMFMSTSVSSSGSGTGDKEFEDAINDASNQMIADLAEFGKSKILADVGLLILAVILFVAGILLVQRYRKSRPILIGWSYAKLIIGLYSVVQTSKIFNIMGNTMGGVINDQIADASAGPPPFDMVKMYEILGIVSLVFGAVWVAILPILFMVWLNRSDIRDDIKLGNGWK